MKKAFLEFLRRGLAASGFGPMVLAVLYLVLQRQGALQALTVNEVAMGIFSLSALAFIAGGMNVIYQIERIPLMLAILLHGGVLYIGYLAVYLMNGWLEGGVLPILAFTLIFVAGYFAIWAIIYAVIRRRTAKINETLMRRRS